MSNSVPTIQFLGAAGTVTGSRYLLSCGDTSVMIDCGLFQGLKQLRLKNWTDLPVDPASIDAVLLTHAHLDHCGYLPKLVKEGFDGPIWATEFTGKLADVIMRDSARIQEEDAAFAAKKKFSKHNPPIALYTEKDAIHAIEKLRDVKFGERIQVAKETWATFRPSGHILGAATIEVEFFEKRLMFTGDLGRKEHALLVPRSDIPAGEFDAVLTESTYGNREHVDATDDFVTAIKRTIARGGSVLIPAFAVDRTEIILMTLREKMEAGEIPRVPIYADSPMALKALSFYRTAINEASPEIRPDVTAAWKNRDPFSAGTLVELLTVEQSKSINDPKSPCIIISASGMGTGGRVVHHLAQMLPDPKHCVILVGYQAIGTRGRNLVDGASEVKMHGAMVPVRAEIEQISSFSVHSDGDELIEWLKVATVAPKKVFVVHGEEGASEELATRITNELHFKAYVPHDGQSVEL